MPPPVDATELFARPITSHEGFCIALGTELVVENREKEAKWKLKRV